MSHTERPTQVNCRQNTGTAQSYRPTLSREAFAPNHSGLLHRMLVVLDVEDSTQRSNSAKAQFRKAMYHLLERAFRTSGISTRHLDPLVDRGDGILLLIRPVDDMPKTAIFDALIPALSRLLAEYNARWPDRWFRMRAAVHAGEVHYDQWATFGEAVDLVCRLIEAPELSNALTRSTAPLALAVSDDIFRSVIRHSYDSIDDHSYRPLIRFSLRGYQHQGWVTIPTETRPNGTLFRPRLAALGR